MRILIVAVAGWTISMSMRCWLKRLWLSVARVLAHARRGSRRRHMGLAHIHVGLLHTAVALRAVMRRRRGRM